MLLVIVAVLIGQADACIGSFVTPRGFPCETCVTTPCQSSSHEECLLPTVSTPDSAVVCHFCCTLKACEGGQTLAYKAVTSSFTLEFDCPIVELSVIVPSDDERPRIAIFVADQFANPPPSVRPSRAPPVRLN